MSKRSPASIPERLPDAAWRSDRDLLKLCEILDQRWQETNGDASDKAGARLVGGVVRDSLLGLEAKDIDLATPLRPDAVLESLKNKGVRAVPTGISHGTITAILPAFPVEITSLRQDLSTDGRHAIVGFTTDWHEDASRRDFTINALYADIHSGKIYDYFDGLHDLARGQVRFIGNADDIIREDYLRILRYFRFFARFGQTDANADAVQACKTLAAGLKGLARERIASEIIGLFATELPYHASRVMEENGIWQHILPERRHDALTYILRLQNRAQQYRQPMAPLAYLAAMLEPDSKAAEQIAARLKMSKQERKTLALLVAGERSKHMSLEEQAYQWGADLALQYLLLHGTDNELSTGLETCRNWRPQHFPVKGQHFIDAGVIAGPDVAKWLKQAEKKWIDDGFPDIQDGHDYAAEFLSKNL